MISVDINNNKNKAIFTFKHNSKLEILWEAFTKTEYIQKWWAPKPYETVVLSNNFENGGRLNYYMLSPEGQRHYCLAEFFEIKHLKSYTVLDAFCDENEKIDESFPLTRWSNKFSHKDNITTVISTIYFDKKEDMIQIFELGFEEGYTLGLEQLGELLNDVK